MLMSLAPARLALLLAAFAVAIIAAVWIFEWAGYAPCHLCLMERWAWYAAIPGGLAAAMLMARAPLIARLLLAALALGLLANALLAGWHAGIEWKLWAGPSACTGGGGLSGSVPDFSKLRVVQCDEAALRILGISLAGWNVPASLAAAALALAGAMREVHGSSSVSQ